ncbi:cobalamin synthase, partial [Sphingomonas sp. LH128]
MKHLVLALQFLTRLPLPAVQADAQDFAKAMRWFPVAGLA